MEVISQFPKELTEITDALQQSDSGKALDSLNKDVQAKIFNFFNEKMVIAVVGPPGAGKTRATNTIIAPISFLKKHHMDTEMVGQVPGVSDGGIDHVTEVPFKYEYRSGPFEVVASFCNEEQFKDRITRNKDCTFSWPGGETYARSQSLFECSSFVKLCEEMKMFKINNYLLSAERFAIEWVTVYGEWAIPKSISIVDLPGFTFSDDPQDAINVNILEVAHIIIWVGLRGVRQSDLELLFAHGGFSRKHKTVFGVIHRDAKDAVVENSSNKVRRVILESINNDINIPGKCDLIEKRNFLCNLAQHTYVVPYSLLSKSDACFKFLNTLREKAMEEAVEDITISTAAMLMQCKKAAGMQRAAFDPKIWKEKCALLHEHLNTQVGEASSEVITEFSNELRHLLETSPESDSKVFPELLYERLYDAESRCFKETFPQLASLVGGQKSDAPGSTDEETLIRVMEYGWNRHRVAERDRLFKVLANDTRVSEVCAQTNTDRHGDLRERLVPVIADHAKKMNEAFFRVLFGVWDDARDKLAKSEEKAIIVKDEIRAKITKLIRMNNFYNGSSNKTAKLPYLQASSPLPTSALRVEQVFNYINTNRKKVPQHAARLIVKTTVAIKDAGLTNHTPVIHTDIKTVSDQEVSLTFEVAEHLKRRICEFVGKLSVNTEAVMPTFIVSDIESAQQLESLQLNLRFEKAEEQADTVPRIVILVVSHTQIELYKQYIQESKFDGIIILSLPLSFDSCDAVLEVIKGFSLHFEFRHSWLVDHHLNEWNAIALSPQRCSFARFALGNQLLVQLLENMAKRRISEIFDDPTFFFVGRDQTTTRRITMQIKEMLKKNDNMRSVPWSAIIDIANQSADPEVARDLENAMMKYLGIAGFVACKKKEQKNFIVSNHPKLHRVSVPTKNARIQNEGAILYNWEAIQCAGVSFATSVDSFKRAPEAPGPDMDTFAQQLARAHNFTIPASSAQPMRICRVYIWSFERRLDRRPKPKNKEVERGKGGGRQRKEVEGQEEEGEVAGARREEVDDGGGMEALQTTTTGTTEETETPEDQVFHEEQEQQVPKQTARTTGQSVDQSEETKHHTQRSAKEDDQEGAKETTREEETRRMKEEPQEEQRETKRRAKEQQHQQERDEEEAKGEQEEVKEEDEEEESVCTPKIADPDLETTVQPEEIEKKRRGTKRATSVAEKTTEVNQQGGAVRAKRSKVEKEKEKEKEKASGEGKIMYATRSTTRTGKKRQWRKTYLEE